MEGDPEVIGIDVFLLASKSRDYRQLVRNVFSSLVAFLQDNGLTTRRLVAANCELPDNFVIRQSDLTVEGLTFYKSVEQKWFGAIDQGAPPTDTVILQRALRILRSREA